MGMLHEKLSYKLKGCIYDVHNSLGVGYDEESYHSALEVRLKKSDILFESKVVKFINHRGIEVHKFVADIIVEEKIILELKNIQTDFNNSNYVQILSYLKNWKMDLGLLVNFGLPSVRFKRVASTSRTTSFAENYIELKGLLSDTNRNNLKDLRTSILTIYESFGLGFTALVYKKLLQTELAHRNIAFHPQTIIPVEYEGKIIRYFNLQFPVIEDSIICMIVAIKEELVPDIYKLRTYLKDANLKIGLLVHFGKKKLEIIGVHA